MLAFPSLVEPCTSPNLRQSQRLKRVFAIQIEKCEKFVGSARVIASVEGPDAIQKILKYLGGDQPSDSLTRQPLPDQTAE